MLASSKRSEQVRAGSFPGRGWLEYKQAKAPADTDLDGMPDEWERKHELDAADASDNSKDSDSDGYTNIEEFMNSTDPRKAEKN